ncbi:MAG: N-6 DNA methylase [Kiritimatiellae bacterium]|nr:N-6 DNA methylase [Kiritimatiellia bacterium]
MIVNMERTAAEQATSVAKALVETARHGGTEADFRREAARILEDAGLSAGLTIVPRDEFSVARGRVDSVYNRLVLEYKRPGILKNSNRTAVNVQVIQQVKDYILDVAKREKREAHRLAGVATDGHFFLFVRRVGEGWSVDEPTPVNTASTERFLRLLFSLSTGAAMVPENLVNDFGPQNIRAQKAVRALYTAMHSTKHPLVAKLFEQWRQFFSEATDYKEWAESIESKPEFKRFVGSLWTKEQIRHLDAAKVFFVLHTYYALLIKLVASLAAARFAGGESAPLSSLAAKKNDDLRQAMADLERGGLFREYGIRNFLEGDFFGWYLPAWNTEIEEAVSSLIQRLAEYDPGTLELAPENARDLLKKLYHYLLPREIRHDLGEYYTPDWLAERLCIQTLGRDLGDPTKRVLDPACGSGTFLVILIKYIRERTEKKKILPAQLLDMILKNVVGIDLNPLAVIAARTNYLLALGDLLKGRKGDIDIPVYQADSVLTPSQGTDLFDDGVFSLKTSVGVFRVPVIFAYRERMDALADVLDDAIESGVHADVFLLRIEKKAELTADEAKATKAELTAMFKQLQELHDQGLNGVWARIIKNSFAPVFLERCHFVVGNPPWVNWESLPEEYRYSLIPLYEDHYHLFQHKGLSDRHGSSKIDISSLMTYVCADKHLVRNGKLGFIITQGLLKTSDAGRGFRKFLLPDGTPIAPTVAEDMVTLNPFEGATNRTAVLILTKGRAVHYPIPYQYWKKKGTGRGAGIAFDTPYEEVTTNKITSKNWYAMPVDPNDSTSAWMTGRRAALNATRKVLGPSKYVAHEGANTGGANAVYWISVVGKRPDGNLMVSNITEGARRQTPSVQAAVEAELVFPLLRGRDVQRWIASCGAAILVPQNPKDPRYAISEEIMQAHYPKAHAYFKRFEDVLSQRKSAVIKGLAKKQGFYFLYSIKVYTLSKYKVVWREQAETLTAAVVGPLEGQSVIPDHKLMMVDVLTKNEAHYLCAVLNSLPVRFAVAAYGMEIQTGVHVLKHIAVPKYSDIAKVHMRLVELSQSAHKTAAKGNDADVREIEAEIDKTAAKLWGLSDEDLTEIKRSLEEM